MKPIGFQLRKHLLNSIKQYFRQTCDAAIGYLSRRCGISSRSSLLLGSCLWSSSTTGTGFSSLSITLQHHSFLVCVLSASIRCRVRQFTVEHSCTCTDPFLLLFSCLASFSFDCRFSPTTNQDQLMQVKMET